MVLVTTTSTRLSTVLTLSSFPFLLRVCLSTSRLTASLVLLSWRPSLSFTMQRSGETRSGMLLHLPPDAAGDVYALAAVDKKWSKLSPNAQDLVARFIPRATPSARAVMEQFHPWATETNLSDIHWSSGRVDFFDKRGQRLILEWNIWVRLGIVWSERFIVAGGYLSRCS